MATKQLGWLIALLAATPALYVACGGDEASPSTTATGTGGAATGTGGATTTGGTGGTGGSGGTTTGGSAGSGGTAGGDSGTVIPDAGVMCGTMTCTTNPTGNNVCDVPNNRCVDCLTDRDCDVETTNKICDVRPTGGMMLPAYQCIQCLDSTQCPAGSTCGMNNTCTTACGTANCTTNPTGNNICDLPNNRCVDCLTDADCAVETTAKHCDTSVNPTNMLPRDACEDCLENAHCPSGQLCVDNNCEPICATDADCSADGGGQTPHCNPTTRVCSECAVDTHCSGNTPICIPAGTCEECTTDQHCMTNQPNTPYCRITDYNCVACLTNDHCTPPATCSAQGRCGGGGMDGGGTGRDGGGGGG